MTDFAEGVAIADGRYTLERRLGSGGMATVWLARDERLGRPVAIKALSDVLADDEGFVRRFSREARVAAGLAHPNLVRVFDFGDEPRPYLVMEYVEGGTLAERLRHPDGALECVPLVRGLLGALGHVHASRIVHRDVKPANVLMGLDGQPRLTDFGIAQPADASRLTHTGGVMGTIRYLAPEVMKGGPATIRSDLYALGMLIRDCIAEGDGQFEFVADRLTAADPAERPESAEAALALLDEAPPAPQDVTAATRPLSRVRRRPALPEPRELPDGRREYELRVGRRGAAIATGVVAAVILAVVVLTRGGDPPPATPPPSAPLARQIDGLDRAVKALP